EPKKDDPCKLQESSFNCCLGFLFVSTFWGTDHNACFIIKKLQLELQKMNVNEVEYYFAYIGKMSRMTCSRLSLSVFRKTDPGFKRLPRFSVFKPALKLCVPKIAKVQPTAPTDIRK
ncbi:hypothetical protein CO173_03430, partial [Candidatus Uhrbacteria bacterium CG_4_9_14_3_um_filter_41_35]